MANIKALIYNIYQCRSFLYEHLSFQVKNSSFNNLSRFGITQLKNFSQ